MIYDALENLTQYRGINSGLDALIDFFVTHPVDTLKDGKIEIQKDVRWVSVSEIELKDNHMYEMHKQFLDIHIPLSDGEKIAYVPEGNILWPNSNEETLLASGPEGLCMEMKKGTFAIFFPCEAHRPVIGTGKVKKIVAKANVTV